MHVEKHTLALTTDASGDVVGYTPVVTGRILQIRYVKTDFADGIDVDVTLETSAVIVWDEDNVNASKTVLPRQGVHGTDGVAATLDGTRLMREPVYAARERVKVVVAAGGAAKTGTFYILIG